MTAPYVKTSVGELRGSHEHGLAVFRGVPYAQPPVGALRWQPARPHPGWQGVLEATGFGASAPQPYDPSRDPVLGGHGRPPFGEDCLTLNIWTPGTGDAVRPVLVWIHGGGFISGSGSLPFYDGEAFARDGDLVVVTINYRLGPLGYLSMDSGGNHWLTDQVTALQWVHDHIASFGGDPTNITVAGQSGGAFSTLALAGHSDARDLIRRVILQSPPLGLRLPTADEAAAITGQFVEVAGAGDVDGLRGLSWQQLVSATMGMFARTARWGHWATPFLPFLDGEHLDRHPREPAGMRDDLDILIGWTRDEATFAFALNPVYADTTRGQVVERAAETLGGHAEEAYEAYRSARPDARPLDVLMDLTTDELFRAPALDLAETRARRGHPVWAYQFDFPAPAYDGRLAATHCLDLPFTFGNLARWAGTPLVEGIDPVRCEGLTKAMHRAWISFVRTGDPAVPGWRPYDRETRTTMHFDAVSRPLPGSMS